MQSTGACGKIQAEFSGEQEGFYEEVSGLAHLLADPHGLCRGVWLTLHLTGGVPQALGEPVSYPVNQVPGFTLTLAEPSWSPFKGYSLRYDVAAESETVYTFTSYHSAGFESLEQQADGQWHRLTVSPPPPEEFTDFAPLEFALGGGESHGLGGSLVQKYAGYGTRVPRTLPPGAEDGAGRHAPLPGGGILCGLIIPGGSAEKFSRNLFLSRENATLWVETPAESRRDHERI